MVLPFILLPEDLEVQDAALKFLMVELMDAVKSVVADPAGLAACQTVSCVESVVGKVV